MKRLLSWCMLLSFIFEAPVVFGVRDLFNIEQRDFASSPLKSIVISDLIFSGAIIQTAGQLGFVEDSVGNVYKISPGDVLGEEKATVIQVLPDAILLTARGQFIAIK